MDALLHVLPSPSPSPSSSSPSSSSSSPSVPDNSTSGSSYLTSISGSCLAKMPSLGSSAKRNRVFFFPTLKPLTTGIFFSSPGTSLIMSQQTHQSASLRRKPSLLRLQRSQRRSLLTSLRINFMG